MCYLKKIFLTTGQEKLPSSVMALLKAKSPFDCDHYLIPLLSNIAFEDSPLRL